MITDPEKIAAAKAALSEIAETVIPAFPVPAGDYRLGLVPLVHVRALRQRARDALVAMGETHVPAE